MVSVTCPQCSYEQAPGGSCRKCAAPLPSPASLEAGTSPWTLIRRGYRVTRWLVLTGLLVVIALILVQADPPQVAQDPEAPARVEAKIAGAEAALRAGQPHQLQLDEAEVNSYLGTNLALKRDDSTVRAAAPQTSAAAQPTLEEVQSSVRDVKIQLEDDRVAAYVLFDFHGKDLSLSLEGRLGVMDGYLRFTPVSGKLGSLPLPRTTLENAVARLMDSPENKEKLRVPPEIADLRIENGRLVVVYR